MRVAPAAVALALLVAAPASADRLVFGCGQGFENICRARTDGSGLQQLTTGGDASRSTDSFYRAPAISRDGRTFAYVFESDVFLRPLGGGAELHATVQSSPLLIRFRPDGARFAVAELAGLIGGTQLCSYNADLSGTNEGRYCIATGIASGMDYVPNGQLLMSGSGGTSTNGRIVIELLRPEDGGPTGVERRLVDDPSFDLHSPSVSPGGRLVAVVQAPVGGGTQGDIALYDLTTGALVRVLTTGGGAAAPVFSPDGRRIAFDRGEAIWVTSASSTPGRERRIVARGRSVSWGGGSIPRAFTRLRVARRQSGGRVRGRLRIAHARSRLTVELLRGGRRAGRLTSRSAPRGLVRFNLALRGRAGRVTVRITVTPPDRGPDTATRTVRVSR